MSYFKIFAVLLVAMLMVACAKNTVPDPERDGTVYDSGANTDAGGDNGLGDGEFVDFNNGELDLVIYFDFNSSAVRPQYQDLVGRHAIQLNDNSIYNVRLEGHADERGSREYNIGLGERRAQSVRQMLMLQGVSASQIQTVSFGEERPAAMGSSEGDYARNRRVEINYTQ